MDIYLKLFEVLFPVFFIVGIGFLLGKKNPNFDTSFITTYAGNFGTPALVIFALTAGGVSFEVFKEIFFYALILLSAFGIVGLIFLVLMKKDYIRELPPFFLPNTGNMGIPICLFAYGELGMGIAAAISSLVVLLHFTLNIFLAKRAFDFQTIFKSPAFYAIIVTVLFLYFEQPVPQFVMNTVMLLAYGMIVMILMSLGVALTQMKVFSFKDAVITSTGRVIIGPLIGLAVIKLFDLSGVSAGVILIQSSMPSAILCYLVASMYSPKVIVDNISSTIVVSTIMSLVTIPITLFFALKYFY
ncbi:AEC family transporter [Pelagibacterales bacterium SAG-MED50]|nr:AEC family transporter [Pelagibacterales bacterium SAG-MED50]